MRISGHFRLLSAKGLSCCIGLAVHVVGAVHGQNVITLRDGNSTAEIDPYSQRGVFQWNDSQEDLLDQKWCWYRTGGTVPQQSIDRISTPVVSLYGTREASISYTANNFILTVDYLLTGGPVIGPPGQSPNSDLGESIRIQNTSNRALEFHFFQYTHSDFPAMNWVQLGRNLRGFFNDAFQAAGDGGLTETITTPGAVHGEVDFAPATLYRLNNISGYNLNDNAGPLGPEDVAYAFQWDLNIAPGSSVLLSMDTYRSVLIPEPSAAALLSCGLVLWAVRRFSK